MEITFLPLQETHKKAAEPLPESRPQPHESRPQYTAQELACYRSESHDVERLFSHAEKTLGKLLSYNDMSAIFGFHDWLRLPIEVIEYLLTYCEENDHRNLRYMEKCAMDWADNNIGSIEEALLYVQNFDRDFKIILRHMGQVSGYPTPTHKKYMKKWLHQWNFPLEIITEACDRCVEQIAKPNFKYVDKILSEWHKKGITALKDIAAADEEFEKDSKKILRPSPKQNRFANFNQRDNDYSQYEKLERAYLEQKYKVGNE
jgi:DnaD/phage-associated family protein